MPFKKWLNRLLPNYKSQKNHIDKHTVNLSCTSGRAQGILQAFYGIF